MIGDVAAAGLHRFGGAVGSVEMLAPDNVLHAEFMSAVQEEIADVVAQGDALRAGRVAGNQDVQRSALDVFSEGVGTEACDLTDLRKLL